MLQSIATVTNIHIYSYKDFWNISRSRFVFMWIGKFWWSEGFSHFLANTLKTTPSLNLNSILIGKSVYILAFLLAHCNTLKIYGPLCFHKVPIMHKHHFYALEYCQMFIFVKLQCFNVSKCCVKSENTFSAVPEVRMTDHDRARINLHTLAQLLGMSFSLFCSDNPSLDVM